MAFQAGLSLVTIIVIALSFFASPTSTHALARAAMMEVKPEVDEDHRPDDRELERKIKTPLT